MSQRCVEFEKKLEEIVEKGSDELKTTINDELVTQLHENMKYSYSKFKEEFENFKYKYNEQLEKQFSKHSEFKTTVRGIKIRGVYDTVQEANNKAKELQNRDRSFHIFVGQVGSWLPWDPCADRIQNEEYLEQELNTMMKKYKENEISRDLFYEEQKREKLKSAMEERLKSERKQKEVHDSIEDEDPWIKSKFNESVENKEASAEATEASAEATEASAEATEASAEATEVKEL